MKCLETERLISYAYHLTDDPAASQVRAHLAECPRCREIVEQHGRLDALLDEWKAAEPTPWFDARVRHAVEEQQAGRDARSFWGWDWARGLALASLGVLIVAGALWITLSHPWDSFPSRVATREHHPMSGPQTPLQTANIQSPIGTAHPGVKSAQAGREINSTGASSDEEKNALALEDYDLAANFDLLSELPKGQARVAN